MASITPDHNDPFQDASAANTLTVSRNVSLTIADSFLVLDDRLPQKNNHLACCAAVASASKKRKTCSITLYNVLWAELSEDGTISIHHAQSLSKTTVRASTISYKLDKHDSRRVDAWIETLLDRAYGAAQQRKRILVLVNPFGGQGGAVKLYQKFIAPIFAAARCELSVQTTEYQGHGVDIAHDMDINAYDLVACCSGDGIPHEVWNGLGKRSDAARALAKMAVVQLPCGSGNALSLNFNGTADPALAALAVVKGLRTPLDLASVSQGDRRTLSFLSQSVGIVAETDLATEHLRWMGSARFTWGFLVRLISKTVYPADIAIKVEQSSKTAVREAYRTEASIPVKKQDNRPIPEEHAGLPPLKYGTINDPLPPGWELIPHDTLGNFYAGNLAYMSPDANFFPASLPADGCLDLIRIRGDISRTTAIKTLLAVENHTFFDMLHVDYQKISAYRIIPKNQDHGYISIDGERVPFQGFQVEVHKGLGTVLSKSGHLCEAKGV